MIKPDVATSIVSSTIDEHQFLDKLPPDAYRDALGTLFTHCRRLGLRFELGAKGTSIRVPIAERTEPVSVAWLFPPGIPGRMGLTDFSLGYDLASAQKYPLAAVELAVYVRDVGRLPGVERVKPQWIEGYRLTPQQVVEHVDQIVELLSSLVQRLGHV